MCTWGGVGGWRAAWSEPGARTSGAGDVSPKVGVLGWEPEPACESGSPEGEWDMGCESRAGGEGFLGGGRLRSCCKAPEGPPWQQGRLRVALDSAQDRVANRVGVSGVRFGHDPVMGLCGCLFPKCLLCPQPRAWT